VHGHPGQATRVSKTLRAVSCILHAHGCASCMQARSQPVLNPCCSPCPATPCCAGVLCCAAASKQQTEVGSLGAWAAGKAGTPGSVAHARSAGPRQSTGTMPSLAAAAAAGGMDGEWMRRLLDGHVPLFCAWEQWLTAFPHEPCCDRVFGWSAACPNLFRPCDMHAQARYSLSVLPAHHACCVLRTLPRVSLTSQSPATRPPWPGLVQPLLSATRQPCLWQAPAASLARPPALPWTRV
jgi:hypothetical protein